jgi:Uma2 family endonuclease
MNTFVLDAAVVQIPDAVDDLASFRQWAHSEDFPEVGRICFLSGEVWVDLSKEQFFTHNQVKSEFNTVIGAFVKKEKLGRYIPDGMLLTNVAADLTSQPDGAYVSHQSLQSGRVRLVEGAEEGYVELEGSPDVVLEVVSQSSVHRDQVTLRDLYWKAGIVEYWLVDARGDRPQFEILKHTPRGYVAARKQAGWIKSEVFGRGFRLSRDVDELGHPEFALSVR